MGNKKSMIDFTWKVLNHVQWRLERAGFFNAWNDATYLCMVYRIKLRKKLDLQNPRSFNEKIQWLKLHDRDERYIQMVDKYLAKKYVAEKIGAEYIVPTIGMWDSFDSICFDKLPDQFVLKTTHDSGGVVICNDKNNLDFRKAKMILEKSLRTNYFYHGREWPYKKVFPRIIAEQFLVNSDDYFGEISDYKVHCFNGIPQIILVCTDRHSKEGLKEDFFDTKWNHLDIARIEHPNSQKPIRKPETLDEMLKLSRILSEKIPFARIDFYEVGGKLYFGEITLYPASGFAGFIPDKWDKILGEWIHLEAIKTCR